MKNKQKIIGIIIIALSLSLAAVGYFILPETLIVQLQVNGSAGNTMPKLLVLLIPLIISILFSIMYIKSNANEKLKHLMVSILGIAIYVFIFIVNL